MLNIDIETNINSIPYLLYMTEQEKKDNHAETDSLLSFSCDEDKPQNDTFENKGARRLI